MKNVTYINAGAGSGKTTELTKILAKELCKKDGRIKPSEVILTTFTKLAASEFRQKAREVLYEKIKNEPDNDTKKQLSDIANQMDAATIGDVHSVSLSFIQKYWYLAGISPDAKVMSEDDMQIYISQSLGNYVTDTDLAFFTEYCNYFDIDYPLFWQDELLSVIEKINHYDIDLNGCIDMSKKTINAIFNENGNLNEKLLKKFQNILTEQIESYNEDIKKKAKEFLSEKPNYHVLLNIYKEISGNTFLGAQSRLTPFVEKMKGDFQEFVKNIKSVLLSSKSTDSWKSPQKMMTTMVQTIFRIASNWNDGFKAFKDRRHIIDYNDMEEKFLKLLDTKNVCEEIKADYKLMMVDEFQDSSPIQLSIFKKLSDLIKHSYWVGDPKQSIYGFRGADVSLVNDLIKLFDDEKEKKKNGLNLYSLPKSYRSRRKLVNLVNGCFTRAFNGIINNVELEPARQDEEGLSEPLAHWNCSGNMNQNKAFIEKTADRVKQLLDSNLKVKPKGAQYVRGIEPGDIAILCLKNSECKSYAKALAARGIPVSFVNDDISQQIEIHLVISLLQLIIEPSNKHVRAELLRLLNDDSTTVILNSRLDYLYKQSLEREQEENPDDQKLPDEWMNNNPLIEKLIAFMKAGRDFSVSDLVENVIYALSLPEVVAKWGEKEIRQQNLSTVRALARQYDSHCQQMGIGASVGGFISYLSYAKVENKIDNSINAVKVLTYHKSKGLEWNYVIMDSLFDNKLKDDHFALWNYWGVREMRSEDNDHYVIQYLPRIMSSITYKSTLPQLYLDNVIQLSSYKAIKERETNQLRHLLYVGMTRARDYLTTLGRCSNARNNRSIPTAYWIKNAGISEGVMNQSLGVLWGEKNLAKENIEILEDLKCRIQPYNTDRYNQAAAGTCIHNIFAVYDPTLSHEENVDKATDICNGNNMYGIISEPEEVINSIEHLYAWLEQTYGKASSVKHEVPFIQPLPGQIVHGEIDLLWYLNDHECVLIDFKNFPGSRANIEDPNNDHYAGLYASQLKAYRDVLKASGITVKDTLIYYSVMGCVVRLNL